MLARASSEKMERHGWPPGARAYWWPQRSTLKAEWMWLSEVKYSRVRTWRSGERTWLGLGIRLGSGLGLGSGLALGSGLGLVSGLGLGLGWG